MAGRYCTYAARDLESKPHHENLSYFGQGDEALGDLEEEGEDNEEDVPPRTPASRKPPAGEKKTGGRFTRPIKPTTRS